MITTPSWFPEIGISAGLENGDYIGLFFRDYMGDLAVRRDDTVGRSNRYLTAWENTNGNDTIGLRSDLILSRTLL